MMKKKIFFGAATILGMSMSAGISAQSIELRVGDSLPPDHIITRYLTLPWIEKVQQLSGGKVKVKHYPAEQAGKAKDLLSLTQAGVLDIGYIGPAYVSDKMPLSGVAELPGLFESSCQVTKAYWSLAKGDGYFYKKEFKPNNVRPLFMAALPPYQITVSSSKTLNSLADFSGLKVRAAGGAQELSLNKLGAVAVKMPPPEVYESMSRKTIDGALLPFISVESYKLTPLIKSSTKNANFGTVILTYSINEKKWQSLPQDIKDLLVKVGDEVTLQACQNFDADEQKVMSQMQSQGVHLIEMSAEDKARLHDMVQQVAKNWTERLDARRKPGSETLRVFNEALLKAKGEK